MRHSPGKMQCQVPVGRNAGRNLLASIAPKRVKTKEIIKKGAIVLQSRLSKRATNNLWFVIFVVPTLAAFLFAVVVPFLIGIYYSFFSWDGIPLNPKTFVGVSNYTHLFSDARFLQAGGRTFVFTFFSVISINIVGLFFALLVTSKLRTRNLARGIFFAPHMLGGLLLGYIWKFVFSNVFKNLGATLGMEHIFFNWLINKEYALAALVVVNTWKMAGYIMIIYIAGLESIPGDVMEAASVDGANYFQRLRNITFPLLMPSFTIALFLSLSNSFKIYDTNLSLTGGGPANATELFAMNIFSEIFKSNNYGYGQAKAIVFFVLVACITVLQTSITKKREVEM